MKRYLTALVALMVMMFAGNAMAFSPPPPPARGWYVVDQANVLTPGQVDEINHRILAVSKVTKNEFGVLILQTMDGANIDDVANATYRAWGVGKRGLDNGILLAISVGDRKWRIEVGKGVEGDVTDLQAADVGRNHLVPHLKQRPMDWYGGILETINTLDGLMESRINAKAVAAAGVPRPLQYANTAPVQQTPYVDPPLPVAAPPVVVAPVSIPVPVLAAPVIATAPMVSVPGATEPSPGGIGVFLVVGLLVLLVIGVVFLYSSYRSSKEEEERQREIQAIEAQNRRARAVQEAAERVAREQEATRLRNQEALNRQATATVVPTTPPVRHTVHHVNRVMEDKFMAKPSRPLDVPARPRPVVVQTPPPRDTSAEDAIAAAALAAAAIAAQRRQDDLEEVRLREEREDRRRQERDEEERQRRARDEEDERRRRREREEEDDRRRRDEESSRSSNDWSSPSSSNDSGGWGGGDSGGGGFGGGDSGGGGASGDF